MFWPFMECMDDMNPFLSYSFFVTVPFFPDKLEDKDWKEIVNTL